MRPRRCGPQTVALLVAATLGGCAPGDELPAAGGRDAANGADTVGAVEVVQGVGPVEVVDATGRRVRLLEPARRIVSLVPSVNQILFEIGAADGVVGRTDYDTLPALAELPSVGGGLGPDLETLASLRPDLVIRFAGDSDTATPAWLDELGVPHLAVRPDRIADVFAIIDAMGRVTGRSAAADTLATRLRAELYAVAAAVDTLPPVRTAYLMGGTPPWTASGGTYIHELVELAGGVNVFADLERLYAPVSPEVVASQQVDVFLVSRDADIDARMVGERPVRALSPGVQLPGPELGAAAREVARALHPGLELGGGP